MTELRPSQIRALHRFQQAVKPPNRVKRVSDWLNNHPHITLLLAILFLFVLAFALVWALPCWVCNT